MTTTTVDYDPIAATIEHRDDCDDPSRWRLRRGGRITCVGCGRWQPAGAPTQVDTDNHDQDDAQQPQTPLQQPAGRYQLHCDDCGRRLDLPNGRPQIALCTDCRDRRQINADDRAARRRAKHAEDAREILARHR